MNSPSSRTYSPSIKKKIISFILFQSGWFCCILLDVIYAALALIVFLLLHIFWILPIVSAWKWVIRISILGWAMDSILIRMGLLQVENSMVIPLWLMFMWVMFAFAAMTSMMFLLKKPLLSSVLSFFGAGVSYYAGVELSPVVSFNLPAFSAAIIVGLCWSIFIPFVFELVSRDKGLKLDLKID